MYCDLGMYLVYAQSTGSTVHGSLVNLEREREREGERGGGGGGGGGRVSVLL